MCWGASKILDGDRSSPAHGRQFCAAQLGAALSELPGRDDLIFDANVVVSELLTHSLRAGSQLVRLSLSLHRDSLRVMVEDDAPGGPRSRALEDDERQTAEWLSSRP
ncbi:MAG: hypothetical protein QOI51_487 [Nocardioidaceae bacterium]|jgi:anti-sigma regulatory factor (Ser/Thr protein kinase)|nr:hypothetical protein [Nocardioidaceae bacterium]